MKSQVGSELQAKKSQLSRFSWDALVSAWQRQTNVARVVTVGENTFISHNKSGWMQLSLLSLYIAQL